jgi:hypothetical protein
MSRRSEDVLSYRRNRRFVYRILAVSLGYFNPPPNSCQQRMAGRSPRPALKRLFPPETNGDTPLADRARRLDSGCGKRRAALPHASGASPPLRRLTLARPGVRRFASLRSFVQRRLAYSRALPPRSAEVANRVRQAPLATKLPCPNRPFTPSRPTAVGALGRAAHHPSGACRTPFATRHPPSAHSATVLVRVTALAPSSPISRRA